MNLSAITLLRAILPETGLYAAWTKLGQRSYNTCLRSIEDLCAFIAAEDAQGRTVYHACASYKDERGVWNTRREKWEFRCQANAYGARAFWFDVDGGPDAQSKNTGYDTASEGAEALTAFSASAGLPTPWYVASGTGVHGYWPLAETLGRDDWTRYASALKACAVVHGLRFDPARTADIASVLRTPGTHNRKTGQDVEVISGPPIPRCSIRQFDHLLSFTHERQPVEQPAFKPDRITQALVSATDAPPAYAEAIANECAHINALRATAGNLPEPIWYACLGVLAWCVDGDAAAHHWSSGHPDYSQHETETKLQRTRELTGATTCAKFESLDHGKCAACPHRGKIKSPISLGMAAAPTTPDVSSFNGPSFVTTLAPTQSSNALLPPLPQPWKWSQRSQLVMDYERDGAASELLISEYPIYLEGVHTGELAGSKFSYLFKQYLPHSGWHDIHLAAEAFTGHAGISKLFGGGAVIHEPKAFMRYVENAVDAYHAQWKLRMRYEQFGWKEEHHAFLYGSSLYRADEVQPVVGSDEIKTRSQWLAPSKAGTLDGWTNAANSLFQLGCEAQSFALLCGFAALFTPFHTNTEGGAIVSLVSRKSGTGKTAALAGAASVWSADKGLALTNIDTTVSKGLTLGVLGNLPVVYDELWDRDPMVIRDFVMMFTNGRDKMRGTREGEIKHTQAQWQTLLIATSNLSLVETLSRTSAIDAPGLRVVEFAVTLPEGTTHAQGDRLTKALWANCGHAGDAFLRYLMEPDTLAWSRQALEEWTQEIWDKTKLRSEHRFWVRTLGSVAVAAALVSKLELLSFQPSRIVTWAIDQMVRQVNIIGRLTSGVEVVAEYLSEHVHNTLVVNDRHHQGRREHVMPLMKPTRELRIRYELQPGRIVLDETPFRKWLLDRGVNFREMLSELSQQGVVSKERTYATLAAGTEYAGGQRPCVEVNARHPMLSGIIQEVVKLRPEQEQINALQTVR